jgi:hypothetical protein
VERCVTVMIAFVMSRFLNRTDRVWWGGSTTTVCSNVLERRDASEQVTKGRSRRLFSHDAFQPGYFYRRVTWVDYV